ncbi:MAG: proline--tRNA ligase, partial [Planctomycetota bacterium]
VMKDAYSLHMSVEGPGGLNETYDRLYAAYVRIFERCGLQFTVVEAEAGPIGGSASHEFMVDTTSGEDTILVCPQTGYAANVEKCEIGPRPFAFDASPAAALAEHYTPRMPGIDLVAEHLGTTPAGMLKTVVFAVSDSDEPAWVIATVRGDHEVNEGKVRDAIGRPIELADEAAAKKAGFAIGYVSPRAAAAVANTTLLIDPDATPGPWATGADRPDHHETGFDWRRDTGLELPTEPGGTGPVRVVDVRNAAAGDPSPRAEGAALEAKRGIEVGHIFKLGTVYSSAFDFAVLGEDQKKTTVIMGCYGIGVSRTIAATIEQQHDERGIQWPTPIAPYHAVVVVMDPKKDTHREAADRLAAELSTLGIDVLIDDRKDRPGVKFKDADLIGIPARLTIGEKALAEGAIEFKLRGDEGKGELVPVAEAAQTTVDRLS